MFKALILIDDQQIAASVDLIGAAQKLAGDDDLTVTGLGINLTEQSILGFDSILQVNDPTINLADSRMITDVLEQVQQAYQFDSIFILATDFGRMVAPRLAMRLKVGLVADITAIKVDQTGQRLLVRPAFSGNRLASIVCESTPIMASVHPNVFKLAAKTKVPKISSFNVTNLKPSTVSVLATTTEPIKADISEAQVLVAAGAGYQAPISELDQLAEQLAGQVAVSKPVVEQQRASRALQVGQSGKTVSPDLYLALGIYGSMQHVEGLKQVKHLISVNLDAGAPMNYLADLTVIGDASEFAKKLSQRLEQRDAKS